MLWNSLMRVEKTHSISEKYEPHLSEGWRFIRSVSNLHSCNDSGYSTSDFHSLMKTSTPLRSTISSDFWSTITEWRAKSKTASAQHHEFTNVGLIQGRRRTHQRGGGDQCSRMKAARRTSQQKSWPSSSFRSKTAATTALQKPWCLTRFFGGLIIAALIRFQFQRPETETDHLIT